MMAGETLLNVFIDTNILILLAYGLWVLIRAAMRRTRLEHAYGAQLGLLNAVFLAIVAAPILSAGFAMIQNAGLATSVNLNLSDMAVAYYLNGGFEMKGIGLRLWRVGIPPSSVDARSFSIDS